MSMSKGDKQDMKSKLKYAIVLLIIVIIVALCGSYTKYDDSQMPLIVFQSSLGHSSYNYPSSHSMWTIDNQGNIYYFNSVRSFEPEEGEDIELVYEELKKDKYTRYIGNIGLDVLKEKYACFHDILRDNHYGKDVSGYDEGAFIKSHIYAGLWMWDAYAVTKKGNIEMITLHKGGDVCYTSEDERMKELADWLDDVLREDVEKNKVRSQEMMNEDYYDEVLEYKKLNQK